MGLTSGRLDGVPGKEIGNVRCVCETKRKYIKNQSKFQELRAQPREAAEEFLKTCHFWATHSRIKPMIQAAKTIKRQRHEILHWFEPRLTNGLLQGRNRLIQAAKTRARGSRSTKNFITMVCIIADNLGLRLST